MYYARRKRPLRPWRYLIALALILALGLVGSVGFLTWQIASGLLYPPPFAHPDDPAHYGLHPQTVAIKSPRVDAPLKGWLFVNPRANGRAILFLNGWRSHRQHMLKPYLSWLATKYTVLDFDHPGCGDSPAGVCTLGAGEKEDAAAALDFLKAKGYKHIGVMGVSMGGTTAIDLAASRPEIEAVVSEATYAHTAELPRSYLVKHNYPFPRLLSRVVVAIASLRTGHNMFASGAVHQIGALAPRPLLLIHGTADHVINPADAKELFDTAKQPKALYMVTGADHVSEDAKCCPVVAGKAYEERVEAFFDRHL